MSDDEMEIARDVDASDIEERAQAALRSMETLRRVLERKVETLARSKVDEASLNDVLKVQQQLGRAVCQSLEQEGKVVDARRVERGGDGLDLASARAEVRRRLDRILAGNGTGPVPE